MKEGICPRSNNIIFLLSDDKMSSDDHMDLLFNNCYRTIIEAPDIDKIHYLQDQKTARLFPRYLQVVE